MNKIITIIAFSLLSLSGFSQSSTYFNKLLFPIHGSNSIVNIISEDSVYYILHLYLDTPYAYNQGMGIMKVDTIGNIISNKVW